MDGSPLSPRLDEPVTGFKSDTALSSFLHPFTLLVTKPFTGLSNPSPWLKVGGDLSLTYLPAANCCLGRLSQVSSHISGTRSGLSALTEKSPDDIVVTCALRTPFTKGGRGAFKDTAAADLLAGAFKALIERSKIDPSKVEDVAVGSVLAPGGGATEFRAAALVAGFPETTAVKSLNRQCSSGLQAVVDVANQIKAGVIDIGVGAGVESMSTQYG